MTPLRAARADGKRRACGWCVAKGFFWHYRVGARRGAVARGLYLACVGAGLLVGLSGWAYPEYRTIHGS